MAETATVAEAHTAMCAVEDSQDVFITTTGEAGESVLGWLTDRDVEEALT